jgi:hypothetical protein
MASRTSSASAPAAESSGLNRSAPAAHLTRVNPSRSGFAGGSAGGQVQGVTPWRMEDVIGKPLGRRG